MKGSVKNPFKFGGEVSGYQFYDRSETAELLRKRLLAGASNIVMFAPRRYGKTSLVAKVLRMLNEADGIPSLMFDLSMVPTLSRFCEEYVNAVYAMVGGRQEVAHRAIGFLANCNPSLSLGLGNAVKIRLDFRGVLTETSISEVLDLPERLAEELGTTPVIAFDEFQEVSEISREFALEKIFRSRIQKHQRVRYLFFGSKAHLLERMFSDRARPFYNAALAMPLSRPPEEESREFIRSHFADAGIHVADEEVKAIVRASDNIPYYLQAISSLVFEAVVQSTGDAVSAADVERAASDLVAVNENYYSAQMRTMSESQRALALAIAREPTREFSEAYRLRYELPPSSTIHSALKELIREAIIDDEGGLYRIEDPIFARYLLSSPGKVIGMGESCGRPSRSFR